VTLRRRVGGSRCLECYLSLSSSRFQGIFFVDYEPMMMMTLHSFEKPRTTHLATQRHIPEYKHPRPNGVHRAAFKHNIANFTVTLPCIVIYFFLNNQPDALIVQILFCYTTLHVSGNLFAHHQEFSTVHSALISFMQVFDGCFQAEFYNRIKFG
jgi:hypothetical protein